MQKTAKILSVIFRVLEIVFSICFVTSLVFVVIILCGLIFDLPASMIATEINHIDIGVLTLTFSPEAAPEPYHALKAMAVILVVAAVVLSLARSCVKTLQCIIQPMLNARPFDDKLPKHLKRLSILTIALGLAKSLGEAFSISLISKAFRIPELLTNAAVTDVGLNYSLDFGFILPGLVILLLSYVFRYGAELQAQADETL